MGKMFDLGKTGYALCGALSLLGMSAPAAAETILYRNDYNVGTDYFGSVLSSSGHTVTTTSGDLSSYNLSDFDLVVYANQNFSVSGTDVGALDSYISGGGRVIYNDWSQGTPPSLGAGFSGNNNQTAITVLAPFATGIGGALSAVNTGWGVFTTGLTATSGSVGATFGNGDAAIVYANGGRTIWNGFLTDTVNSSQLYQNELAFVFGGSGAVPEPATWAMMIAGFGLVGGAMRRRQSVTRVAYA